MPDYDLGAVQRAGEATSAALDELQEPALEWAREKIPILKRWRQAFKRARIERDLPEDWEGATAAQLLAGALFGNPPAVGRFLRDQGSSLSQGARQLAQRAADEPWRYAVFSVREQLQGDIHLCADHDTGSEFLLLSTGVSALSREGVRLFMSLLLDNGGCRQAFGTLHYFRGYQPYDFAAFAEAVEPQHFAARGLSATIGRHPEPFLLLSLYGGMPPSVFRGRPMVICADWHPAQQMPEVAHPEKLEVRAQGHLTQLALAAAEPDAPSYPQHGLLYFDAKKRVVLARAMGTVRYAELVEAAGPAWGFSALPRWKAGMTMVAAMHRILHKDSPGTEYLERFEEEDDGEEPPELKRLNAMMADLTRRTNAGLSYSIDDLADLHGVDRDTAYKADESLRVVLRRHGIDPAEKPSEGGIAGLTPPPPDARRFMQQTLERSALFEIDGSTAVGTELAEAARRPLEIKPAGGRRGEIRKMVADGRLTLAGLPRFIEEEFLRAFELQDVTILSYTLYLLLRVGDELRPVPQYATEIIRVFGQILARHPGAEVQRRLTDTLTRFCTHVLEPLGLVETQVSSVAPPAAGSARGVSIRTTPVFRRWLRPSRYWE